MKLGLENISRLLEELGDPHERFPSVLVAGTKFHQVAPFTFFEGLVVVSALYFLERKVDIAVFEVGLGGRLDATRLVNAVLTVITGISLDHVEHLGKTREAILNEKLQIVRGSVPLVANL